MELLRADSDRTLADVDRRIRIALTAAAQAAGPKAQGLMAQALADGPSAEGAGEAARWFGRDLKSVLKAMDPMIYALNAGMPGFSAWLDRTGYGNDVTMIRALWAWFESDPELGLVAASMQHGVKALN